MAGPDLRAELERVKSREDLARFVSTLAADATSRPDGWAHATLPAYLEAVARWLADMDGYHRNRGEKAPLRPAWRTLGEVLLAARVYE